MYLESDLEVFTMNDCLFCRIIAGEIPATKVPVFKASKALKDTVAK